MGLLQIVWKTVIGRHFLCLIGGSLLKYDRNWCVRKRDGWLFSSRIGFPKNSVRKTAHTFAMVDLNVLYPNCSLCLLPNSFCRTRAAKAPNKLIFSSLENFVINSSWIPQFSRNLCHQSKHPICLACVPGAMPVCEATWLSMSRAMR